MEPSRPTKSDLFFKYLKNVFWVLLILQFAPGFVGNLVTGISDSLVHKEHIGQLTINGMISDSTFYVKNIRRFAKDRDIKGLLIRIESPGGYPGSAQAVFQELQKFAKEKPVVVFVENMAASAAYYVACAADKIISTPSAAVGSVGVFCELPNYKELLDSWKVKFRYVQSGAYKTAGSPVADLSEKELLYLQELSDDTYHQFVNDVAQSRSLDPALHTIWANGKTMTGNQALALNLVDDLGSWSDALAAIKELAKIEGKMKLVQAKRKKSLMNLFMQGDEEESNRGFLSSLVGQFLSNALTSFYAHQSQLQTL